jgi:FkbM family methyltransferase
MPMRFENEALIPACARELERLGTYSLAERVDNEKTGILDVLFAYRLLLGRWPEFGTMDELRRRTGDSTLKDFVKTFLTSPEFRARLPEMAKQGLDLVVMRELPNGLRMFFNLNDEQALRIVMGLHEPETEKAMRGILREGMNCIDAGAHIGLYSLLMASFVGRGGRVFAIEPVPTTFALLKKNVEENGFGGIIQTTQAACHAEAGVGRLFRPQEFDLGSMFVKRKEDVGEDGDMDTALVRLDDIVHADVLIGLVKLDIERSEPFAIEGMTRIMRGDRPVIFTEFIPGALERDPLEYLGMLRRARYRLYTVQDFLDRKDRQYDYTSGSQTENLVCLPE